MAFELYKQKDIKRFRQRRAEFNSSKARLGTRASIRDSKSSTGLMQQEMNEYLYPETKPETKDPVETTMSWASFIEENRSKMPKVESKDPVVEDKIPMPRSRDQGGLDPSLDEKSAELFKDPYFKETFDRMVNKYDQVTKYELLRVIDGESSMDPTAKNPDSNASGLFQFIPKVAAELGFTPEEIRDMPASSQLKLYEKYLDNYDYDGSVSLGIMQAAPAKRNASPDTVIYKKGSAAWKQNPGWRDKETGNITRASIDAYYRRNM